MKNSALITGLIGALTLGAGVANADPGQHQHPLAKKHPQSYTCSDLIGTAVEYIPEVVYWHDGWNSKSKTLSEEIDEAWVPVDVDAVMADCRANPSKKLADVTRAKRDQATAAAKKE